LTSAELNLIGKKTDEAVDLTDKFLDEVFLNGVNEVRIIHGHAPARCAARSRIC